MKLVIGNKTYSSWSLRPWILMRHHQIPFDEILVKLDTSETPADIAKYSPAGRVPILIDGALTIWDSMAIMEYLHEKFPEKKLWPSERDQRSRARSISLEMHSGFQDMRNLLMFHAKKRYKNFDWSPVKTDVARIQQIWTECLQHSEGPYLYGHFTIADAMFAPVVNRFIVYGVPSNELVEKYIKTMTETSAFKDWMRGAMTENFTAPGHEREQEQYKHLQI